MKCRRRSVVADVVEYKVGMEDGFDADRPYVEGALGKSYLRKGDLIVTLPDGTRLAVSPKKFSNEYDIIPEYSVDPVINLQETLKALRAVAETWMEHQAWDQRKK